MVGIRHRAASRGRPRERAKAAAEAAGTQLADDRTLLPRLKRGVDVNRPGVLVPRGESLPVNFPSEAVKARLVREGEVRIAANEAAAKAFAAGERPRFGPELTGPAVRGPYGRVIGGRVRTTAVLGPNAAVVTIRVPDGRTMSVLLVGPATAEFAVGLVTPVDGVFVVTGSETVDGRLLAGLTAHPTR